MEKVFNQIAFAAGYSNIFEIADTRQAADGSFVPTYGAIAIDADGGLIYSFYVTPFADMVEHY